MSKQNKTKAPKTVKITVYLDKQTKRKSIKQTTKQQKAIKETAVIRAKANDHMQTGRRRIRNNLHCTFLSKKQQIHYKDHVKTQKSSKTLRADKQVSDLRPGKIMYVTYLVQILISFKVGPF